MRIITWNANRVDRWDQLWQDKLVASMEWDLICLQEVGNPQDGWQQISGPKWAAKRADRDTDEPIVRRQYTYQPKGYPQAVNIVHGEWPNRQKNHLALIAKNQISWVADISGQMGERPALATKVRLTGQNGQPADVLVGTVHILATPRKAPAEVGEMLQFVESMVELQKQAGWLLFGDFNCDAGALLEELERRYPKNSIMAVPPGFQTHQSARTIDYLLTNVGFSEIGTWTKGTAASDHALVCYDIDKIAVQVL
jgi:endonuclease/exonuclease/phosphatase family metal-dependent hydrolase